MPTFSCPFWCFDAKGGEESRVIRITGVSRVLPFAQAIATLFASYLACATICYRLRNHLLLLIFCVWTSYCMLNLLCWMIMLAVYIVIYLSIPCLLPKDIGGASHVLKNDALCIQTQTLQVHTLWGSCPNIFDEF